MATTLSLDRYAEMQADVEAGRLRDEVLDRAGLSVEEWTAAQRQWLDTMGSELALDGFELTNRYTQVFLARRRALAAPAPAPAPSPSAAAPRVAAPVPESVPLPVEATPSYLAANAAPVAAPPAPAPAVKRAPAALAGTSMGFVAPRGPALPFAAGAPSPAATALTPTEVAAAPATPMPPVKRAPAALAGTSMGFVAPLGPALPFATGAAPSPPATASAPTVAAPSPPVPPIPRAPAAPAGTSMGFVAPRGPELPFARGAPAEATATPKVVPSRDETLPGATLATTDRPPGEPPRAVPAGAEPPDVRSSTDATTPPASMPEGASVPLPLGSSAVPAVPAAAAPPPTLTLQQYASLCAELAVFPARSDATFQQYGLGELRDRLRVDLSWQERLRRNPAEHQGWQVLYQRWVAHFEEAKQQAEKG